MSIERDLHQTPMLQNHSNISSGSLLKGKESLREKRSSQRCRTRSRNIIYPKTAIQTTWNRFSFTKEYKDQSDTL